jgi:hypothetical protein
LYLQTLSKRAYLFVVDADALYAEYAAQGVEFTRGLGNMPWHKREFVVKDCDGRLLAFGANLQSSSAVLLLFLVHVIPNPVALVRGNRRKRCRKWR